MMPLAQSSTALGVVNTIVCAALLLAPTNAVLFRNRPLKAPVRPDLIQNAIDNGEPIYYFGLGSNMLREKLENRGINGTKIDILAMEAGVARNHRLAFNMRGFPPLEPGMGSLEPTDSSASPLLKYKNDECHGALVKVTPENYERIAQSEGVTGAAQQGYDEIVVEVHPYTRPDRPVKAIALRAREHVRLSYDPCPSQRYMDILKKGANELGLRPCYREFLENHPIQTVANWQRHIAKFNLVTILSFSFALKWRGPSRLQSRLLFMVYVPSNEPNRFRKFMSEVLTVAILFPGATLGCMLKKVYDVTGKGPPALRMLKMMFPDKAKEDPDKTNEEEEAS